jgi:hypothetical protein
MKSAGRGIALLTLLCALFLGASAQAAGALRIDQARGADPRVDYASLLRFGPWDDRNYALTREDLALLAANESELADPIPAFFRVELRREFPQLPRTGEVQYPRAAVPLFQLRYGGLMRDGHIQRNEAEEESGDVSVPVNAEVQLNNVLGANEVTVEINPVDASRAIASANVPSGQETYWTSNGGQSWTIQGVLPNTCCDPSLGWSADGTIAYVAALSGNIGVSFWRSFDNGHTWQDRVTLTSSGSDKEFLHVDVSATSPFRDHLYMTYHNSNVLQFGRSTNLGQNWTITAFRNAPHGIGSDITSDAAGNIYYFYGATDARQIILLNSTDGGDTFAQPIVVATTQASFDWPIPSMETRRAWIYASADADRSNGPYAGSVYVAWTDTTAPDTNIAANNHTQIHVAFSRDGGHQWQQSIPHETADVLSVDRFNQWLTVDRDGVVHVVYYDTRNAPDRKEVDMYYSFSTDGGVTWNAPQRVSSATSANLTDGQEWGDYNGISVLGSEILTTWTDNRGGPPNRKNVIAAELTNAAQDADADGVVDSADNCTLVSNADQRDTDGDGFGNICDADLNNNCVVNSVDLGMMKSVFFTNDADADLNGDGAVNFGDLALLKTAFFLPPGPSGVPNNCDAH